MKHFFQRRNIAKIRLPVSLFIVLTLFFVSPTTSFSQEDGPTLLTAFSPVDSLLTLDSKKPHVSPWLVTGVQAASGFATYASFFFPFNGYKTLGDSEYNDPAPYLGFFFAVSVSPLVINFVGNSMENRKGGYWRALGLGWADMILGFMLRDFLGASRTPFERYLGFGVFPILITVAWMRLFPNDPIEPTTPEGNKLRLNFVPVFSPNHFGLNISGSW